MRQGLTYVGQSDFRGGINQEPSSARTNQVLDARNVYINERGDLAKRPGVRFVDTGPTSTEQVVAFTGDVIAVGSTNYTGSTANFHTILNALSPGDVFAYGFNQVPLGPIFQIGISSVTLNNDADTFTAASYWNGTEYVPLEVLWSPAKNSLQTAQNTFGNSEGFSGFGGSTNISTYNAQLDRLPTDWAQEAINATTRYWLRFTVLNESPNITNSFSWTGAITNRDYLSEITPISFSVERPQQQRIKYLSPLGTAITFSTGVESTFDDILNLTITLPLQSGQEPGTIAVIPEAGKVYIGLNNAVIDVGNTSADLAEVNSDPGIIGDEDGVAEDDVLYDKDRIAQLDKFPEASYVLYFKGRLWCAGIRGKPFDVRWSGPTLDAAFDVWPSVSFEVLSEDDNSPITGLASLNEHPVVFKRDSIWLMVFSGTNELGLASYSPVKVVSGIGTVSQASIKNVNGQLIFLAEDGFYAFDGTPNVRKLSDNIDLQVSKIAESRKKFASGVHWRSKNLYMCAASIEGSDVNNFVFVYDYKHGGWWFWEGLNIASWLKEEDDNDRETILYSDNDGRIYELTDRRLTDAGLPITGTFTPLRLGYGDGLTKRWRDFRSWGTNATSEYTMERLRQDRSVGSGPVAMTDTIEAKWDVAEWGTGEWVQDQRVNRGKVRVKVTSEWWQPKITHSGTDRFEFYGMSAGFTPLGIR